MSEKQPNQVQINALHEVIAACKENMKWRKRNSCKSFHLSGNKQERSSATLHKLVELGLIEGKKWGNTRQARHTWTVTKAGYDFVKSHKFKY